MTDPEPGICFVHSDDIPISKGVAAQCRRCYHFKYLTFATRDSIPDVLQGGRLLGVCIRRILDCEEQSVTLRTVDGEDWCPMYYKEPPPEPFNAWPLMRGDDDD